MKGGREHRVPLSEPALAILHEMIPGDDKKDVRRPFVFPGAKPRRPLSNMAMLELFRRINAEHNVVGLALWSDPSHGSRDVVPHGFRSSFRDWAAERTNFPREVTEAALAHIAGDETERAYRRGDLLKKRRRLMAEWTVFCGRETVAGEVVTLRGGR
jgi:integrase